MVGCHDDGRLHLFLCPPLSLSVCQSTFFCQEMDDVVRGNGRSTREGGGDEGGIDEGGGDVMNRS